MPSEEDVRELTPVNPLTGEVVGRVPVASAGEVDAAVERARKAFWEWGSLSPVDRRPLLRNLKRVVAADAERVAEVVRSETGKDLGDLALTELAPALAHTGYLARHAHRILSPQRVSPAPAFTKRAWVEYHPRGVAGVIAPWNYPFLLPYLPTVTALAAGCTVVLKPSEVTPLSGALIADLVDRAGFPGGVLQVVQGGGETGASLAGADVDVISLTGSSATARRVAAKSAESLTPLILELGGKDAMVVLEDADLGRAARGAVWGGFFNAGQNCIAVERVYVVESVYDEFLAELDKAMDHVTATDDPATGIGPIIHPPQFEIIERHIADAVSGGARVLRGGSRVGGGSYFEPTLVVEVDHTMPLMREETFGPVLAVMPVPDEDTALALANDSPYGLHGSVWTGDRARGRRFASLMHTGTVAVNDCLINFGVPGLTFGGVGESGYGRQAGPEGLRAYCYSKGITDSRIKPRRELQWFPRRGSARIRFKLVRGIFGG